MSERIGYGLKKTVEGDLKAVEERVRSALAEEGFGVLSEIDIQGALQSKLGVDFRPYKILGACNPPLAHEALSEEIDIGLLLPCNLVVYEADEPGHTTVAALDPAQQLAVAGRDDLGGLASDVQQRMERVISAI